MAVTSRHNKYTSIPDWFSGQSTETATTSSSVSQTVYISGSSGSTTTDSTVDFKDIPIDASTIVWQNELLTVPIDNDKIIIVDGKVTTSLNSDGVWELRLLADGTNYIYTTYPVVTQLGITMYSGTEGLDIGGIYDGLPIDNTTIYWDIDSNGNKVLKAIGSSSGGGVADSVAWANVVGKPVWLLDDKISYSEIEGTPDLSKYALVSLIPSLEGYALSSDLAKYIPISGYTDITGEKNFTGGLKINGSPIYYDTENKYWKLEGDLLLTGGLTMYGNDSDFVASTIMGAILYDDSTLGINANGELYVKGGMGDVSGDYLPLSGGVMTGWIGLPKGTAIYDGNTYTLFGFNPSGDDLFVGHNLHNLTIRSYDTTIQTRGDSLRHYNINTGVTSTILDSSNWSQYITAGDGGSYLPLSGGTLTNTLTIDNSTVGLILHRSGQATPYIRFGQDANNEWGELGVYNDGRLVFWPLVSSQGGYGQWNTVWHSGNDGSGSGLDADLLDGLDSSAFFCDKGASNSFDDKIYNGAYRTSSFKPNNAYGYGLVASFRSMETCAQIYFPDRNGEPQFRMQWNSQTGISSGWTGLVTSSSIGNYNAGSATRIQAYQHNSGENVLISGSRTDNTFPRYIYDNGWCLCLRWREGNGVVHNGTIATLNDNVASATKLQTARTIWGQSFDGTGNITGLLSFSTIDGSNPTIKFKNGEFIDAYGNIQMYSTNNTWSVGLNYSPLFCVTGSGNVGIGTTTPSYKLDIVGHCRSEFMYFFNKDWNGNAGYIGRGSSGNNRIILYAASDDVYIYSKGVVSTIFTGANMLVQGGITMYSARKLKNITDERGLSLEELSVIKPTRFTWKDGRDNKIHIGGIADDVMKVLPEVIYKADNDTLTMDYGNAAFAIAASLIKPVVNHEERIKVLEEENKRLKEEVEQLKWNIA